MDILYSGTVSARKILGSSKDDLMESNIVLNINTPYMGEEDIKSIEVCKIGGPIYDYYIMEYDENGERTINLKGRKETESDKDTDRHYLSNGYVGVTPLNYDLANYNLIEEVKNWV